MTNDLRFARNVIVKALLLFAALNLLLALARPLPLLGRISAYNHLFPGRLRLPYSDVPDKAYSLSLFQLEAMFASHELTSGPKPLDEYHVLLVGDSSTWGFLLPAGQTLSAALNIQADGRLLPDGRRLRFYNLGYPVMSLTKDLLILSRGLQYQPDLIVWLVTLESFPYDKQLFAPLLRQNPQAVRALIDRFGLKLDPQDPGFIHSGFWDETIVGQRRALADLLRLQLYGVMWTATGIDQYIPTDFTPRMEDMPADERFHDLKPPHLQASDLALDVLRAGLQAAGKTPVLLVNEPMFISQGENSDIRYNFYYPRWAYDDYRSIMAAESAANGWEYLDVWDLVPGDQFTNSAVHLSAQGTEQLAMKLFPSIINLASSKSRP
jgi:hypothetical protein